jgi:archaeal type IV pilus assembly protein PilA
MRSFSNLNIERDTFMSERLPLQSLVAEAARKDYTMKSVIRKDEAAVSPVIATILMVAITVVLAAVLYVMVSGLITPVGSAKPTLAYGSRDPIANGQDVVIGAVQPAASPSNFRVNLRINTTFGTAVAFPATTGTPVSITVSGYTGTFTVTWQDPDGGSTLSGGDHITVVRATGLPAKSTYELILFWVPDGSAFPSATWNTP